MSDLNDPQDIRTKGNKANLLNLPTVQIPIIAVIGEVEATLSRFYQDIGAPPEEMCIDFSKCNFIEIATLQFITATIKSRLKHNQNTILHLPFGEAGLKVRHFLRRWKFGAAVKDASGKSLNNLVRPADLVYFRGTVKGGDKGDPYAGAQVIYNDRFGERIYRKNAYRFFGFKSWKLDSETDKLLVVHKERERWVNLYPTLRETLRKQLRFSVHKDDNVGADGELSDIVLTDRIVLQAITNALRHPEASIIQASSHMAQKPVPADGVQNGFRLVDNFFTIVYWDDGVAIHQTLKKALLKGLTVNHPTVHNTSYLLKFEETSVPPEYTVINSSDIPNDSTTDERLFLSTIFPGVTCDITGGSEFRDQSKSDNGSTQVPGHGLFVLAQTAIDTFGGSVAFRTNNMFMNVSRLTPARWRKCGIAGDKPDYYVKIMKYPEVVPHFLGNQITIRLPLLKEKM
jgi:hypothetical protein